jgi:hypothetical protein
MKRNHGFLLRAFLLLPLCGAGKKAPGPAISKWTTTAMLAGTECREITPESI